MSSSSLFVTPATFEASRVVVVPEEGRANAHCFRYRYPVDNNHEVEDTLALATEGPVRLQQVVTTVDYVVKMTGCMDPFFVMLDRIKQQAITQTGWGDHPDDYVGFFQPGDKHVYLRDDQQLVASESMIAKVKLEASQFHSMPKLRLVAVEEVSEKELADL